MSDAGVGRGTASANVPGKRTLTSDLPLAGPGAPLPVGVRVKMERAFGADFSAVRVHEGPQAEAIGAFGYTRGADIYFAPGQYEPESERGQELLGHELAHVVQQSKGGVAPTTDAGGVAVNADPSLEREADEAGVRAVSGAAVSGDGTSIARPAPATSGMPLQGKFRVDGQLFDYENKDSIPDLAKDKVKDRPHKAALIDKLVAMAGQHKDHGDYASWPALLEFATSEVTKDSQQFHLAAGQILTRFPPADHAYVGLGGSPDPIMQALQRQDKVVVLSLPLGNISLDTLGPALKHWDDDEDSLVKSRGEDDETVSEYIDNYGVDDYGKDIKKPLLFRDLIRKHLDTCASIDQLEGKKNVLVIDYVNLGGTMQAVIPLLRKYYKGKVNVISFGIGNPTKVDHSLDDRNGTKPDRLTSVFSATTYKRSHRTREKFDVLILTRKISDHISEAYTSKLENLEQVDTEGEPDYQRPLEDKGAVENIDALLDLGDPVKTRVLALGDLKELPQTRRILDMQNYLEKLIAMTEGTSAKDDIPVFDHGRLMWLVPKDKKGGKDKQDSKAKEGGKDKQDTKAKQNEQHENI